mmetsp:Transcript_20102/g.59931  ORF Transcript_20102/g.59931 Transcript_20102/m.59931 type:complete len:101 (+) Transcript_20102:738-1040(+)
MAKDACARTSTVKSALRISTRATAGNDSLPLVTATFTGARGFRARATARGRVRRLRGFFGVINFFSPARETLARKPSQEEDQGVYPCDGRRIKYITQGPT